MAWKKWHKVGWAGNRACLRIVGGGINMIRIQCIKFLKQKYFRCVILEMSHMMQWASFTGKINLVQVQSNNARVQLTILPLGHENLCRNDTATYPWAYLKIKWEINRSLDCLCSFTGRLICVSDPLPAPLYTRIAVIVSVPDNHCPHYPSLTDDTELLVIEEKQLPLLS